MIKNTRDIFLLCQKMNLSDRATNIIVKHWKSTNIPRIISGSDTPKEEYSIEEVLKFLATYQLSKLTSCGVKSAKEINEKARSMLENEYSTLLEENSSSHEESKHLYKVILLDKLEFIQFMWLTVEEMIYLQRVLKGYLFIEVKGEETK